MNIPEILVMPVHDMSLVGVNLFLCSLGHIGQKLTLQGFSVRHFSVLLWSRHRTSCKESVHFLKAPPAALLALQPIQTLVY